MTDQYEQTLAGRVALVTGASRGIGAAVALAYARAGAHVVLTARNTKALEGLDDQIRAQGGAATLIPLDLLDHDKIDAMGPALAEKFGRLDIFVGNAGMLGTLAPLGHINAKEWDRVIALNLTANFRLIRTLDPLLRASDAGRVIFVTSGAAEGYRAYWGAYAASKAGLESLARTYKAETDKTNIRVNLVDPGRVRTAMRAEAFPGEDPQTLVTPDRIVQTFLDLAGPSCAKHGERVRAQG
ncbi:MAG: SDR family NAD(P)-dependent oxidoreductase [Micavibrio aeruginosavorus]|nr:SDR family NAD(P)-dependent oxidoreductase [Micavibrio aeruginosavorus]